MQKLKKGLLIGGVFASQTIDKSGEIIDIDGLDITNLCIGDAYLNSEHKNGSFENYLGRIVKAKKIYDYKECESEYEKKCFKQAGEIPIVYGIAELFDDEGHQEALAASSIIRHFKTRNLPIAARFSIEGTTLEKEGMNIKKAIAQRVALTMVPCNDSCISDVVCEMNKSEKELYEKLTKEEKKDYLCKGLSESLHTIEKEQPNEFIELLEKSVDKLNKTIEIKIEEEKLKQQEIDFLKKKTNLKKTLLEAKLFALNFLIGE